MDDRTDIAPTTAPIAPTPGWYEDPDQPKAKRWWNGSEWGAPSPEDRQAALDARVAQWIRAGYRVEAQSPTQAVMVTGRRPNHVLHIILSVLTLGLWLIVWFLVACFSGEKRKTISVAADGRLIES